MTDKKIYFLSDIHLGAPYIKDHKKHEQRVVSFLESIKDTAEEIYFLGDVFDFWFEYRFVIPQGFTRFLGKIAELSDCGIKIHMFGGNHDMWMFHYFQDELGVEIHQLTQKVTLQGKDFFLAHGEDLGVTDKTFLLMLKIFRASWFHWFSKTLIHPDLMMKVAKSWSVKSRHKNGIKGSTRFLGEDREYQVKFAKNYKGDPVDFFIFGHRHIVLDLMLSKKTRVIILGDWISNFTYAELYKGQLELKNYEE